MGLNGDEFKTCRLHFLKHLEGNSAWRHAAWKGIGTAPPMAVETRLEVVGGRPHYQQRKDETNMKKLYIAYGSNMDEEQMAFRCPTATLVGTAIVEGYELIFKGSRTGSYATIEPKEGSIVPVLVWEIGQMDERRLDYYEGYPNFTIRRCWRCKSRGK